MNEIVEMNRTGYELVAWKPDTEDWVKNRKYIAVLNEYGRFYIQTKNGEGIENYKFVRPNEKLVFSFVHFVGFDYKETEGIYLVFETEGRQTALLLEDCTFYKHSKPPVLEKEILNILKQNQI